jgi:hypothetical protein
MAKQKGAVKLSGTIGEISFYEAGNEFLAKGKGGPTREQVLTKKSFERTRENAGEFGRCSKGGKLIRTALLGAGTPLSDPTAANRLTERLVRVMHSDTVSPRGQRRAQQGQLSILENFEFLEGARLADTFFARYEAACHREAGTCTVTLPPFIPKTCIQVPPHATRVKLVATALAVDFGNSTVQKAVSESEPLRLDGHFTEPLTLTCTFKGATELPVLLVLGLLFMEEYEGFCYPMREKQYNSLAIVLADKGS